MKDVWSYENSPVPFELGFSVSREAVLLYLYTMAHSDASGFCDRIYLAAARAGLNRAEASAAVKELVDRLYIEISEIPDTYGTSTAARLVQHAAPVRQERLTGDVWRALKARVFERDDYTCQYCFARGGELECDHVEPISRGGTNEMGNLVTACQKCNRKKHAKLLPLRLVLSGA